VTGEGAEEIGESMVPIPHAVIKCHEETGLIALMAAATVARCKRQDVSKLGARAPTTMRTTTTINKAFSWKSCRDISQVHPKAASLYLKESAEPTSTK
jgi:hypothetical protein